MLSPYLDVLSIPGARQFTAWGVLARIQMGMTGLATFLLVQMEYGSYELAGMVLASIAISYATLAPIVARLIDTHGQSRVLRISYAIAITGRIAMVVAALTGQPIWVLMALAPTFAAVGSQATLTRARWTHAVKNREQLNTAFSLETSLEEVLFIMGPVMTTILATQVASWLPPVIAVVTMAVGGYMFLTLKETEPPVKQRSSDVGLTEAALALSPTTAAGGIALPHVTAASARRRRSYRNPFAGHLLVTSPTLAITVVVFMTQGMLFASVDASTVAFASEKGQPALAGLVLAVWAFGSLVGGVLYGSRVWHSSLATRLLIGVSFAGLGVSTFMFAPSLVMLGAVMFIAGLVIAPTMVVGDSLVNAAIARGRVTEGMTWTRTGIDIGIALGAWLTGAQIDAHGAQGGFTVTMLAGLAGIVIVLSGWRYIRRQPRLEEDYGHRVEPRAVATPASATMEA
ncbi:MAG: MFS transporter [Actinobacteria bacterium HGW-Actinobacteria-4]|nr:MAG: MFS transporter [Actinobacteria bacterium HGW-Actinobacteria-4]